MSFGEALLQYLGPARLLALVAGVGIHVFYLNRGDHHLMATTYLQTGLASLTAITLVLARDVPFTLAFNTSLSIVISLLVGIYGSLLVYRLLLHPLRSFPGPWAARLSDLWFSAQLTQLDAQDKFVALYEKYGPFVRIGSSHLVLISPAAVSAVYGPDSRCLKAPRADFGGSVRGIFSTDPRVHRDVRRVWAQAFSDKSLRLYEPRVAGYVEAFVERAGMAADKGQPLDIVTLCSYFAFDIMGDLGFNKDFSMLKKGEQHNAIQKLLERMKILGLHLPAWSLGLLLSLPLGAAGREFEEFCNDQLAVMMNDDKFDDRKSIMGALISHAGRNPGKEKLLDLQVDGQGLVVAGSDTTAGILAVVFYFLAKFPRHVELLRKELLPLRNSNGKFEHRDIQHANHLNGVINEALRLWPPALIMLRVTPPEGINVDGVFIPGNMKVSVPQFVLSRREDIYERPLEFIPERWYDRSDMVKDNTAFAPFSIGGHSCLGRVLALIQMRLIIAEFVSRFNLSFSDDHGRLEFINKIQETETWRMPELMINIENASRVTGS